MAWDNPDPGVGSIPLIVQVTIYLLYTANSALSLLFIFFSDDI